MADNNSSTSPLTKPFPPEMNDPYTAWPWLLKHKPWIFDGIDVTREPYAHYLKHAQRSEDAQDIAHLVSPTQADVAEVLFGDRTKTGGSYRRRILAALEATTTNDLPDYPEIDDIAA